MHVSFPNIRLHHTKYICTAFPATVCLKNWFQQTTTTKTVNEKHQIRICLVFPQVHAQVNFEKYAAEQWGHSWLLGHHKPWNRIHAAESHDYRSQLLIHIRQITDELSDLDVTILFYCPIPLWHKTRYTARAWNTNSVLSFCFVFCFVFFLVDIQNIL